MAVSAHAHRKWPKWVKTRPYWQKIQAQYKSGQGELYYGLDILPKSTTMTVSAHAQWQIRQKKLKRKHGAFAASSHSKENSHVQLC